MDNVATQDIEKGISHEDTQQSETTTQSGPNSSPRSTSWSFLQLIRPGTGSCKSLKRCRALHCLIFAASGESPVSPRKRVWPRWTTNKGPSQNEALEGEEEEADTENIVRRRQ